MTPEQKYLFDLQGFIVLEDVVPRSVIKACNQALDGFEEMDPEDYPPPSLPSAPRRRSRSCTSPTSSKRPRSSPP